ncbi:MAG: hypothetical protein HC888_00630 [Candidatus Competibacteraceae bacterium]|nr:hypothetical protein [Candidatus Competibacteraceae bacterium]
MGQIDLSIPRAIHFAKVVKENPQMIEFLSSIKYADHSNRPNFHCNLKGSSMSCVCLRDMMEESGQFVFEEDEMCREVVNLSFAIIASQYFPGTTYPAFKTKIHRVTSNSMILENQVEYKGTEFFATGWPTVAFKIIVGCMCGIPVKVTVVMHRDCPSNPTVFRLFSLLLGLYGIYNIMIVRISDSVSFTTKQDEASLYANDPNCRTGRLDFLEEQKKSRNN